MDLSLSHTNTNTRTHTTMLLHTHNHVVPKGLSMAQSKGGSGPTGRMQVDFNTLVTWNEFTVTRPRVRGRRISWFQGRVCVCVWLGWFGRVLGTATGACSRSRCRYFTALPPSFCQGMLRLQNETRKL